MAIALNKWSEWLLFGLLDLASGYGFKPWRCLLLYINTILALAIIHWIVSQYTPTPYSPWEAFVVSIQACHVAGFFIGTGIQTAVNTAEALVGIPLVGLIDGIITDKIGANKS